jgi:hypothetical protein
MPSATGARHDRPLQKPRKSKPRKTKAQTLLEKARREPSPTCHDPRQLSLLEDHAKAQAKAQAHAQAFAKLDRAIEAALGEGKKNK